MDKFRQMQSLRAEAKKEMKIAKKAQKNREQLFLEELFANKGRIPLKKNDGEIVYNDFETYMISLGQWYGLDENESLSLGYEYYDELIEAGIPEDDYIIDTREKSKCFANALKAYRGERKHL